jgi:hypothetical protein
MMEPNQPDQRLVANQDFLKALHELEDILQQNCLQEEDLTLHEENQIETPELDDDIKIDLAAWEDAVADIEQFLESKEKQDEK